MMQTATFMNEDTDRGEFSRLAREHHRMLLVYARSLVRDGEAARELVQDALVAAWKNMARFDVTRDFGSWLRGIVRNKWKDYCRRMGRRPEFAEAELAELEGSLTTWDEGREPAGTVFGTLDDCRAKLPEAFAQAVDCFYYDGLTGDEASEKLGINAATLRKRLERARTALRECMDARTATI
jgi:RNA polymerase sigma-70 factor (ECF subfamily)